MCDRCEVLEAEILSLRAELHYPDDDRRQTLRYAFGLTTTEANMVLVLYAAKGRTLTYWMLAERTGATETHTNVKTFIKHIRYKMGSGVILSRRGSGVGYRISSEGIERLNAVLDVSHGMDKVRA